MKWVHTTDGLAHLQADDNLLCRKDELDSDERAKRKCPECLDILFRLADEVL